MKHFDQLALLYASYLVDMDYNTTREVEQMSIAQLQDRFFEIKIQEEVIAEHAMLGEMEEY